MSGGTLQSKCFSCRISEECQFLVEIRNRHDHLFPENGWDTYEHKTNGNKLEVLSTNLSPEIK